jgi:hypothetical protein
MFGKVILGDNQFLGVHHANQRVARELYSRFKDPDLILGIIGKAYEAGVRDFMFTTHERYEGVFDEIRRSRLFPDMYYSPCLPYAHRYWNQISDLGMPRMICENIMRVGPMRILPAVLGLGFGRYRYLVEVLTHLEMIMTKGLRIRGVFLQNLFFDFLVAMEMYGLIEAFAEVVQIKFKACAGFVTMNHNIAVDVLCDKIGISNAWLCSNYNLPGFRMNPCPKLVMESFAKHRTNNIAMSVLASGKENAETALRKISGEMPTNGVDAILFGSSQPEHIFENVKIINEASKKSCE